MSYRHCLIVVGLSLLGTAPLHADVMPIPGGPRIADCSKARDPARCESRIKARQACSDKRGDSKRICMDAYLVAPDCARADNPRQCVARQKAEKACHGQHGKALKSCIQTQLRKKR